MKIWIDGDACPRAVKALVFKTALRLQVPAELVANRALDVPRSPLLRATVVGGAVDAADRHILAQAAPGDLAITADIPLASALVDKGVAALDPRGTVYNADNVKEALATRNLMQDLREGGLLEGGPPPLGRNDAAAFANALDRELTRLRRLGG